MLTVEEQLLEGGFGSIIAETLIDRGTMKPAKRLGLKDGFEVVNGDRDTLHDLYGIDTPHIVEAALALKRGLNWMPGPVIKVTSKSFSSHPVLRDEAARRISGCCV